MAFHTLLFTQQVQVKSQYNDNELVFNYLFIING